MEVAAAIAKQGSGVRAQQQHKVSKEFYKKWVELPDCPPLIKSGKLAGTLADPDVSLDVQWTGTAPDNAAAATCKNSTYIVKPTNPTDPKNEYIYEPVIRQQDPSFKIPDDDHHVTEHMQGVLYPTDIMAGPKVSDYTNYKGKKMGGDQWKPLPKDDEPAPAFA